MNAKHLFKVSPVSAAIALSWLTASPFVQAQDTPSNQPKGLEVIEVTAQKRTQAQQEVPVAISVLDDGAIERLGVNTFDDVSRVSPSVSIRQGDQPLNNVIRMRGVGTSAYSIAAEPSVSVVVDEVPLVATSQAFGNLVDIQQIEVLRGPQGTLFGKNASAGLVNVTTKAASPDFEGMVRVSATTDDEVKTQVSLSGPASDQFLYRISGYYLDRDGYINNVAEPRADDPVSIFNQNATGFKDSFNGEEGHGIRGKFEWYVTDELDLELIHDSSKREASSVVTYVELDDSIALEGITPSEENTDVRLDTPQNFEADQSMTILKANYAFNDDLTLSAISSIQSFDVDSVNDSDDTDAQIGLRGPSFLNPLRIDGGPETVTTSTTEVEAVTHELRLTSTQSEKFEYLVGLFYSDQEVAREFLRGPFGPLIQRWDATASTTSTALFGQGTYQLVEDTFIDIGLRFNNEDIDIEYIDYFSDDKRRGDGVFSEDGFDRYTGSDSQSAVTGKVALRHFLADGDMIFGSVSTGYKGQAYDVASGFGQFKADNPTGEETSVSYELGIKGMNRDRTFSYEVVAFLTDFEDYQAQGVRDNEQGVPDFALNNVGELQTRGIEADLAYQVTDNFRLDASIAYTDAVIDTFTGAPCYSGQTEAEGCFTEILENGDELSSQDLSGKDLNNSPDLKFNVGGYWEKDSAAYEFSYFALFNYQWQDDVNFDLYADPLNQQEAYGIANFAIGINGPDEKYKVELFVNNAFDQNYSLGYSNYASRKGPSEPTAIVKQWSRGAFRYAGINLTYRF